MNTIIRLKIKKDIDTATEKKILKLKGGLIAQSFTDIIHFEDDGQDFYIHYFSTTSQKKQDAITYISSVMTEESLTDIINIF